MAPAPLSTGLQSFTLLPTIKLGPSGAGSWVGGLVHALGPCGSLQRPLLWGWESFLLRPNPHGHFQSEVWGFISRAGALGCTVCFAPPPPPGPAVSPVYLCANVGPRGATCCFACPVLCHSESGPLGLSVRECGAAGSASRQTACPVSPTLRQSRFRHGHVSPLHPSCRSLPLLRVWMNVYFLFPWCRTSLPFDFLSVLVVQGGAVCLPMPPSWFFLNYLFNETINISND